MGRVLKGHLVEGSVVKDVKVEVKDDPGAGGACHEYEVSWKGKDKKKKSTLIKFQKGPIQEKGQNGVTNEALLAIVLDRLQGFQNGKFATRLNELAIQNVQATLNILHTRTGDRITRGVEGKSKP